MTADVTLLWSVHHLVLTTHIQWKATIHAVFGESKGQNLPHSSMYLVVNTLMIWFEQMSNAMLKSSLTCMSSFLATLTGGYFDN